MQKVIAKIHLGSIRRNAERLKANANAKLCAVVKADGYGHGAEEIVAALAEIADVFAVALIEEGLAIRVAACGKDVLVFTPPLTEEEAFTIASNGFIATLPDLSTARLFAKTCEKYGFVGRVHLKTNTGMNRYGMNEFMLGRVCKFLQACNSVRVEGVYSHLYVCDYEVAKKQLEKFKQMQRIARGYFPQAIAHLSSTYGALLGGEFSLDMVRVGIGLYGYSPIQTRFPLEKAASVWTRVVARRRYSFGGAGYGRTKLKKGTFISVCRVGYADGVLRKRENGTEGAENNLNNLCMDVCLRGGERRKGAWVPVLLDADATAKRAGTIAYEVLCAATRRAERVYDLE